jgi:hypothetical protein
MSKQHLIKQTPKENNYQAHKRLEDEIESLCSGSIQLVRAARDELHNKSLIFKQKFDDQHQKRDMNWVESLSLHVKFDIACGWLNSLLFYKKDIDKKMDVIATALISGKESEIDRLLISAILPDFRKNNDMNQYYNKACLHDLLHHTSRNPFYSRSDREYTTLHLAAKVAHKDSRPLNHMLQYMDDCLNSDYVPIKAYIAEYKIIDDVKAVFERRNGSPKAMNGKDEAKKGNTILHTLIKNGTLDDCKPVIDMMIRLGANFDIYGIDGMPAFHYALEEGKSEIAQYLLAHAPISLDLHDAKGRTPIEIAHTKKNIKLENLLNKTQIEIASQTRSMNSDSGADDNSPSLLNSSTNSISAVNLTKEMSLESTGQDSALESEEIPLKPAAGHLKITTCFKHMAHDIPDLPGMILETTPNLFEKAAPLRDDWAEKMTVSQPGLEIPKQKR